MLISTGFFKFYEKDQGMKNCSGFTLLEVLIAMAILMLVLTSALRLQLKSTEMVRVCNGGFEVLVVAGNHLQELMEQNFTGEEEKEEDGFYFKVKTEAVPQYQPVTRMEVSVKKEGLSSMELAIYRYK